MQINSYLSLLHSEHNLQHQTIWIKVIFYQHFKIESGFEFVMAEHNNFSGGFISPMLQDLPEIPTSSTTSEFLRLKIISGHNLPNADVGFGNKSDRLIPVQRS